MERPKANNNKIKPIFRTFASMGLGVALFMEATPAFGQSHESSTPIPHPPASPSRTGDYCTDIGVIERFQTPEQAPVVGGLPEGINLTGIYPNPQQPRVNLTSGERVIEFVMDRTGRGVELESQKPLVRLFRPSKDVPSLEVEVRHLITNATQRLNLTCDQSAKEIPLRTTIRPITKPPTQVILNPTPSRPAQDADRATAAPFPDRPTPTQIAHQLPSPTTAPDNPSPTLIATIEQPANKPADPHFSIPQTAATPSPSPESSISIHSENDPGKLPLEQAAKELTPLSYALLYMQYKLGISHAEVDHLMVYIASGVAAFSTTAWLMTRRRLTRRKP